MLLLRSKYLLSQNDAGRGTQLRRQRLPVDGAQLLDAEVVVETGSAESVSARDIQRCHERLQTNLTREILIDFLSVVINVGLVGGMALAADSTHRSAASAAPAAAPSPTSSPRMSAFLHCGITSHTYLIPPANEKQEHYLTTS